MEQEDRIIKRNLRETERRVSVNEDGTPIVIEAGKGVTREQRLEYLRDNSSELLNDISHHGALLLRGFNIDSALSFEEHVLSVSGMHGLAEPLLVTPGRAECVAGTKFVSYTGTGNKNQKTGGTLKFEMFHSEHYTLPEVPCYICFWCEIPGKMGGETGLVNMAKVYEDLPAPLQKKLKERVNPVRFVSLARVADRYSVAQKTIITFFDEIGVPIVEKHGERYLALYKPNVLQHPFTGEHVFLTNLNFLRGLRSPLIEAFKKDYRGWPWMIHRVTWMLPWRDRKQEKFIRSIADPRRDDVFIMGASDADTDGSLLTALFDREALGVLALAVRRNFSSFAWKRGDVMIVDNLKMAHTGMSGWGKRSLKVMMCNPITFVVDKNSPGLYVFPSMPTPRDSLRLRLKRFGVEG